MPSTTIDAPIVQIGSQRYLSVSDTARVLGISRQGVHVWIRKGKVDSVLHRGRYYVALHSVKKRRTR